MTDCALCRGPDGDPELDRIEVWSDDRWRLTTSVEGLLEGEVPGFSYLEPRRHVPHVEDLDGDEATTFGATLGRCAAALKAVTGCERVYLYVFGGGIAHLHVHLVPHVEGDVVNDQMVRGSVDQERLPSGAWRIISRDFPERPDGSAVARATAEALGRRLARPIAGD